MQIYKLLETFYFSYINWKETIRQYSKNDSFQNTTIYIQYINFLLALPIQLLTLNLN